MSLLGRFLGFGSPTQPGAQTSGTANPEQWFVDLFGGVLTSTGIRINPTAAMTVPGFAAGVNVLAEDLAKVPLKLYRKRRGGGKELATDHPLYRLLIDFPSPWLNSFVWRRSTFQTAILRGNALSRNYRNGRGEMTRIGLIKPGKWTAKWTEEGEPFFDVNMRTSRVLLGYQDVIHLAYRADVDAAEDGGVFGVSPVERNREAIALAIATERFASMFFKNGARPSLAIEMPGRFPDEKVAARIRTSLERAYSGVDNAFKIAVLELGMKLKEISYKNSDSQLIEVRKEQALEMCRIIGVPPHKIGILDRATFSNIEHQSIDYVTGPLSALARAHESALETSCLSSLEQEEYDIEYDLNGLLRGDIQSRYKAYAIGRQWGWLSADDVREFESMNPLPDGQGKTYMFPVNMTPANDVETPEEEDAPDEEQDSKVLGPDGFPIRRKG